jgi:hypothetical protein
MNKHTKRILIIVDVINQLKSRRFTARPGHYIYEPSLLAIMGGAGGHRQTEGNGKDVQKATCTLKHCEACAKGTLFLSYIERFNTVDSATLNRSHEFGFIENKTGLGEIFAPNLLAEIEAAFEGNWYVVIPGLTDEARKKVYAWRQKTLATVKGYTSSKPMNKHSKKIRNAFLIAIMETLLENNGTKLVL